MQQSYQRPFPGDQEKKSPSLVRSQAAIAENKARRARKTLARLFPFMARRLHKGVRLSAIHQHALMLSQPPPAFINEKTGKCSGNHKAA